MPSKNCRCESAKPHSGTEKLAGASKLKVKELIEATLRIAELGQILQFVFSEKRLPLCLGAHVNEGDRDVLLLNLFAMSSKIVEGLTAEGTTGVS